MVRSWNDHIFLTGCFQTFFHLQVTWLFLGRLSFFIGLWDFQAEQVIWFLHPLNKSDGISWTFLDTFLESWTHFWITLRQSGMFPSITNELRVNRICNHKISANLNYNLICLLVLEQKFHIILLFYFLKITSVSFFLYWMAVWFTSYSLAPRLCTIIFRLHPVP